jgi:hypothetical protein
MTSARLQEGAGDKPHSRRGFLAALAALPLIGGAVRIIGAPSAVDVPATVDLLRRYQAFLARENLATLAEIELLRGIAPAEFNLAQPESYMHRVSMGLVRPDAAADQLVKESAPSSRAALVLSAAGAMV